LFFIKFSFQFSFPIIQCLHKQKNDYLSTITLVLGTPNFQQFIICIVRLSRHILPKMSLLKKLINFRFSCKKISFSAEFLFLQQKNRRTAFANSSVFY